MSDEELLEAIEQLRNRVDPPPADLSAKVLAHVWSQDLDYELLTLVEGTAPTGVRSVDQRISSRPQQRTASARMAEEDEGVWSLSYSGPGMQIFLRVTKNGHQGRIDGWVVPGRPLKVRLLRGRVATSHEATTDSNGRFSLPNVSLGLSQLSFCEGDEAKPLATPPFWI